MKTQALTTTLSTEVLTFYPEGPPPTFEVTVHNVSQTFASFQLDMAAAGVETQVAPTWYRVAPAISSKIPGGARTRFQVSILAVPPLPSGFSGTVNLTLRVSSLELRQEDRQILRLVVEGRSRLPPRLTVPSPALQSHPQGETMIPVQVQNLNRQSVDIHLRLTGIPAAWLPDGFEKPLHLPAQEEATVEFRCLLPEPSAAPSGQYPPSPSRRNRPKPLRSLPRPVSRCAPRAMSPSPAPPPRPPCPPSRAAGGTLGWLPPPITLPLPTSAMPIRWP
jgi:hypothetical protein